MRICIIPARGGSKRIPKKNIKFFLGKPVIAYTIQTLLESNLFEHVVVSTDDEDIASIASEFGAEVPWRRPSQLSDDEATTDSVLKHAVEEARKRYGDFNQGCCVYPVNPLMSSSLLRRGLAELVNNQAASAFPVVQYDFPIDQALLLQNGRPVFRWPEAVAQGSQSLPKHYHDAGMFYWFDMYRFLQSPTLFSEDSIAFEIDPLMCQDVNTAEDWALVELKYIRLKNSPGSHG